MVTQFVQDHTGISNVAPADAPLKSLCIPKADSAAGEESVNGVVEGIHDYIGNLRFCISPMAFFQVRIPSFVSSFLFLIFLQINYSIFQVSQKCRLIPLLQRSFTTLLGIGQVWVRIRCFLMYAVEQEPLA